MKSKTYCELCGAEAQSYKGFIYQVNNDENFQLLRCNHSGVPCMFTPYVCDSCHRLLEDVFDLLQDQKRMRMRDVK